jgi:hypothetical protein
MNWNSAGGWATVGGLILEILIILWGVFRHFNKIERRLDRMELEYKPNHGSSMRDAVNRIEKSIAKLEGRFEQHVEETE